MILAKALIASMYRNFDFIEILVKECKKAGFLTRKEIFNFAMFKNGQDREKSQKALEDISKNGILKSIDQGATFKIQHNVMDFILSLIHEQDLGLAGIIDVERKEIEDIGQKIQEALDKLDFSAIKDKTIALSNQIGNIEDQLVSDRDAIKNIVEEAKGFEPNTPLKVRYRKVFECFDHYIDPMISLLDNNVSGFQEMLYQIENVLKEVIRKHRIQKGLATLPNSINGTICQMHKLIDLLDQNLDLYQNELAPLRNEIKRHDEISAAINKLFSYIRKKGVRRTAGKNLLKIGGGSRTIKVSFDGESKVYAGDILNYKPEKVHLDMNLDFDTEIEMPIRIEDVIKELNNVRKSISLMVWLKETYPMQKEKHLLSIYHHLIHEMGAGISQREYKESTNLQEHKIIFYPHYLEKNQ